jgi:hypothetical protein
MLPESEPASRDRALEAMESWGMTNLAAPGRIASHGMLKMVQVAPWCKRINRHVIMKWQTTSSSGDHRFVAACVMAVEYAPVLDSTRLHNQ